MKNKQQDPFEKRIRERLQSVEAEPAGDAWDRIAGDLAPAPSSGYRYRPLALLMLLLALVGGAVWWATIDSPPDDSLSSSSDRDSSAMSFSPDSNPTVPLSEPVLRNKKKALSSTSPAQVEQNSQPVDQAQQKLADPSRTTASSSYPEKSAASGDKKSNAAAQGHPTSQPEDLPATLSSSDRHSSETAQRSGKNTTRALLIASVESNRLTATHSLSEITLLPTAVLPPSVPKPEAVVAPASRWEAWVTVSPLLLYQRVVPNPSDTVYITSLDRSTFSQDRWGAQLRLGGRYTLNERWAARVGVYYRYTRDQWSYRYRKTLTDTFAVVRTDNNAVEARPIYKEQTGTIRQTYHNLGGLVGVQYRLSNRWNSNIIGVELQAHPQQGGLAWYAHSSYVAEKALSDHWSVSGGVNFLWNLSSPETQIDYFQLKPYGFGAQVGVSYKLRLGR